MKLYNYMGLMAMAASMTAVVSCSDFNDWNTAPVLPDSKAEQTIWQNIQQKDNLKDFAKVLAHVGFDKELDAAHNYSVWAPVDGSFDMDSLLSLDSAKIVNQFIKNHVAEYSYRNSGETDAAVHFLNGKTFQFKGNNGSYVLYDIPLADGGKSVPCVNGELYSIVKQSKFLPNIYEFIEERPDSEMFASYIRKYDYTFLDLEKSIPGPIVQGMQTYLDSVYTTENTLFPRYRLYPHIEDSIYTALYPSDKAYESALNTIKSYLAFKETTPYSTVVNGTEKTENEKLKYDFEYYKDSLARQEIMSTLFYSARNAYNACIDNFNQQAYPHIGENEDTICTPLRRMFSEPKDIFDHTAEKVTLSNGSVRILDTLAIKPWEFYLNDIEYTPSRAYIFNNPSVKNDGLISVLMPNIDSSKVDLSEFKGSRYSYFNAPAESQGSMPELWIYVPGVQSTTYNVYLVTVPADIDKSNPVDSSEIKPCAINVSLTYVSKASNTKTNTYYFDGKNNITTMKNPMTSKGDENMFLTNTERVDTISLGQVTFPIAYAGLENAKPHIKIESNYRAQAKYKDENGEYVKLPNGQDARNYDMYSYTYRIAKIIFRPVEYDEYLESLNKSDED